MLPRTALRAARPAFRTQRPMTLIPHQTFVTSQVRRATAEEEANDPNVTDPGMNGGYPMFPAIKRQHRDPYGDWWDKQDRRNFGEPVHEDNDILGIFATEDYDHVSPGKGAIWFGTFVLTFCSVLAVVYQLYPDKPTVPRTFPGGLEKELGGPNAVPVSRDLCRDTTEANRFVRRKRMNHEQSVGTGVLYIHWHQVRTKVLRCRCKDDGSSLNSSMQSRRQTD